MRYRRYITNRYKRYIYPAIIIEKCCKESDYDELVKKEYDGLTDQEKYILWNYAAVYSQDEEMDLEDFTIQSMIDSCGDMRYDEEME